MQDCVVRLALVISGGPKRLPPRHFRKAKKTMVGRGGLEPPTSRLSGVRSNHLSYRPKLILQCKIDVARQAILHRKICREGQTQTGQATTNGPAARVFNSEEI